ncbi:MAG: IMP dehydrogenase [Planctomycetes bacterium]|nr:IMP dehydrogenase [Planctomycetota bacterium]
MLAPNIHNGIHDGETAAQLFGRKEGLTYNDFIILPGQISFGADQVDLSTRITRRIALKAPICSSPMDTVTESSMAIALALCGGIGIIHYNNTVEEQVREVRKVKRFENGFITDPRVLSPDHTIRDVDRIRETEGFSGIPITEDGTTRSRLIGIVTNRDIDFEPNRDQPLREVMTTRLITAPEGISLREANQMLKESKKGKLPIIDREGRLVSLVSRTDLKKNRDYPDATKNEKKQLRVGAAISTRNEDRERLAALVEAGVDLVVIDSAQGDSLFQIQLIEHLKTLYPQIDVLAGNVVTQAQCLHLIEAGADGIRVGMGPGSICITQETMAVGRAQATAVYRTSALCRKHDIPVVADGGISNIGFLVKALAVGGSVSMMGGLFAGTQEAPGDYFYKDGVRVKKYRGMASVEAMEKGGAKRYYRDDREIRVAQGVSGLVVDKGSILDLFPYLQQGLRTAFQDMGYRTIPELHAALEEGRLFFEARSFSAQREGGVHSLFSYQEPVLGVKERTHAI